MIQLLQAGELIKIMRELSAPRRGHWLHNTQQRQKTNIRAFSGIQARYPNTRAAAHLRLRPHGLRKQYWNYLLDKIFITDCSL
jgi:hypothetical protein